MFMMLGIFLSGCATYKFEKASAPNGQGYIVSYDDKSIPEYTLGQKKSYPEMDLAKKRFSQRRAQVEYYYKQMGQIQSRIKEYLWEPPALLVSFVGGVLRWPFIAVADYKYNHNPGYRARVDKLEEQKEAKEKARKGALKAKLDAYIEEELSKESSPAQETKDAQIAQPKVNAAAVPTVAEKPQPAPVAAIVPAPADNAADSASKGQPKISVEPQAESIPVVSAPVVEPAVKVEQPEAVNPQPAPEKKQEIVVGPVNPDLPQAVIVAQPQKGASPLKVKFQGSRSTSRNAKIIAYNWDFGDGDTSTRKNPVNTYWSAAYGSRKFTATLTVKDDKGQSASSSVEIELLNN